MRGPLTTFSNRAGKGGVWKGGGGGGGGARGGGGGWGELRLES